MSAVVTSRPVHFATCCPRCLRAVVVDRRSIRVHAVAPSTRTTSRSSYDQSVSVGVSPAPSYRAEVYVYAAQQAADVK